MGTINLHRGKLRLDFYFRGRRCRESTGLADTPANRRRLRRLLQRIDAAILLGTFNYGEHFPNSRQARRMQMLDARSACAARPGRLSPFPCRR